MATSETFIHYVLEQLAGIGELRYRKMFGEYMVYLNDKPVLVVCDNTVFVKKLDCIHEMMSQARTGFPYQGAKEHYILEIDHRSLARQVVVEVEKVTPIPKKKSKKVKSSDGY